jgi:hypothetical protein
MVDDGIYRFLVFLLFLFYLCLLLLQPFLLFLSMFLYPLRRSVIVDGIDENSPSFLFYRVSNLLYLFSSLSNCPSVLLIVLFLGGSNSSDGINRGSQLAVASVVWCLILVVVAVGAVIVRPRKSQSFYHDILLSTLPSNPLLSLVPVFAG